MAATLTSIGTDMKHKPLRGNNEHRLEQNPLEKRFAEIWENKVTDNRLLDYLLSHPNAKTQHFPTDHEHFVAATVIQWLGSPVGQHFLTEVLGFDIREHISDELKDVS